MPEARNLALASDLTDAAVLDAVPCYPVPPSGASPAIDALRASRTGHGYIVGKDGVVLVLRRPWLALDQRIATAVAGHPPYGPTGGNSGNLRCGLIPHLLWELVLDHFRAALPNEAAAFVIWNENTGEFMLEFPAIEEATPSRLVYRTPQPDHGCHVICDLHSHGTMPAFFSATDDRDDTGSTKIAVVVGNLGHDSGPSIKARLCAHGMFLPMPAAPFVGLAAEDAADAD